MSLRLCEDAALADTFTDTWSNGQTHAPHRSPENSLVTMETASASAYSRPDKTQEDAQVHRQVKLGGRGQAHGRTTMHHLNHTHNTTPTSTTHYENDSSTPASCRHDSEGGGEVPTQTGMNRQDE